MGHKCVVGNLWTIVLIICLVLGGLSAEIENESTPPKHEGSIKTEEVNTNKKHGDLNEGQSTSNEEKEKHVDSSNTEKIIEKVGPSTNTKPDKSEENGKIDVNSAEHPKVQEQAQNIPLTENKDQNGEKVTETKQEQKVDASQETSIENEKKNIQVGTNGQQQENNRPCFPSEQLDLKEQNELKVDKDAITTNTGGKLPDHHQIQKEPGIHVQDIPKVHSQDDATTEKVVTVDDSKKGDKTEDKTPEVEVASKALEPPVISEKGTIDDGAGGAGLPDMPGKDDVIEPPKQREDMPSFGEWKQKMLEEQEKTKQREALTTNNGGSPTKSVKTNMKRVNYAAMQCGAKVLASNPEAQNPSSILNENKDQYIINPCKAKKWVVVELCEPIQVRNIEIANLELFSSLPESFVVSISDRYPTKEWNAIGTLHAREERTVQSFSLNDEEMFAKFVKIDMLAHYGKEHYCPLTLLRVYGTTGEEDDDTPDSTEDEGGEGQSADKDKETNLFTTATNTVLTLVKSVLGEEEPAKEEDLQKVISLNTTALNASVVNATKIKNETAGPCAPDANYIPSDSKRVEGKPSDKPETPCVRDRNSDASNSDSKASTSPTAPSTGTPPIKRTIDPLPDINDDIKKLVTLIETPTLPLRITLGNCNFCEKQGLKQSSFDMSSSCGYYRLLSFKYPTTCAIVTKRRPTVEKLDLKSDMEDKVVNSVEADKPEAVISMSATVVASESIPVSVQATISSSVEVVPSAGASPIVDIEPSSSIVIAPSSSEAVLVSEVKPTPTLQESKGIPSQRDGDVISVQGTQNSETSEGTRPRETSVAASAVTKQASDNVVESKPINVQETAKKEEGCDDTKQGGKSGEEGCTMGPQVVQIRPTSTVTDLPTVTEDLKIPVKETDGKTAEKPNDSIKDNEKTDKPTSTTKGEDKSAEKPVTDSAPSGGGVEEKGTKTEAPAQGTNGMKDIYAESAPSSGEFVLEPVPVPDTNEPVQKLSSGKRETTVMRLKNRIKQLELNLNLSSRYLEELSQRYKKHMEEMYNSLNKTIARLSDTARSAAIRDEKQQEHISALQKKLENVTDIVDRLSDHMDSINSEVVERHLYLMFIEVVVFLLALAWCMNRQTSRTPPRYTSASSAYSSSTSSYIGVDALANTNPQHRPRRSSIGTDTPTKRNCSKVRLKRQCSKKMSMDDMALVRSGSESDLHIIEPNINLFLSESTVQCKKSQSVCSKKKKKKRYSGRQSWDKQSSTDLLPSGTEKNASNSGGNLTETAGILFGGKGSCNKERLVNGSVSSSSIESNSTGNLTSWSQTSLKSKGSQSYSSLVSSKSSSRTDIKQTISKANGAINGHLGVHVTNIGRKDIYNGDSGTQSTWKHNSKKGSSRNGSPQGLT